MTTISFKADDNLKNQLDILAERSGINTSAYIKFILTKQIAEELSQITPNGLTVAEELSILSADKNEKMYGPFTTAKSLMKALKE